MTSTTTYCGNCGSENLGTRFCETCGAEKTDAVAPLAGPAPATVAPLATTPSQTLAGSTGLGVGGLPLALFLGGVIASSLASLSFLFLRFGGSADVAVVDVLAILFDSVKVVGVLLAGVRGTATPSAKLAGLLIALLAPVLDVVVLATNLGGFYAAYGFTRIAFLIMPILTVLAWLLVTALPGRAYRSLFIVGGAVLLSGIGFIANGGLGVLLSAAGVIVAVLVAPTLGRPPVPRGMVAGYPPTAYANAGSAVAYPGASDGAYAVIGRPTSTNSFAVVALIFGLMGGTVLPVVFGHVAHSQIRRTGERGWGMATAGLVLGYISCAVVVIIIIVVAVSAARAPHYYG